MKNVLLRPRTLVGAAIAAFVGCNVPLEAATGQGPINTCSASSDCAADAACVQGRCVATSYDLDHLVLQVRPQAGSTFGSGTVYVIDPGAAGVPLVSSGAGSPPFRQGFNIGLTAPVSIHGGQVLSPATCPKTDGSVPATITFYRVSQVTGLPFDKVQATTKMVPSPSAKLPTYAFDVDLVSLSTDRYDVYIEPDADACGAVIPPYFLAGQTITSAKKSWSWTLPTMGALSGTINGLSDATAWQVDLVEPSRGLTISANSTLQLAINSGGATVTAQIFPIDPSAWPILRLTPVDPNRPTVYWSLQNATGGTQIAPQVNYTLPDLAHTQTSVQGQVLSSDGTSGLDARLALQSKMLSNANNVSFAVGALQTDLDAGGSFGARLPPGSYAVRVFPTLDNGNSISDRQIKVAAIADAGDGGDASDCDCEIPLQLDARALLTASVKTADGRPLASATASIAPTQALARTYLASTLSLGPLQPRVETTTTDASGSFSLLADLGTIDLVVQPNPGSNLPWLVVPQVSPDAGAGPQVLALPSPAFLYGTLSDPQGNPVTNAEIDAFYPVRDPARPSTLLGTVVKIGTTSTDASGAYALVLPASVPSGGLK